MPRIRAGLLVLVLALGLLPGPAMAQAICTWYRDATAAVSLTFDDGSADQISVGAPALEANGWFGTFYLVTNWTTAYAPWKALADRGHEIGAHSTSHQDYSTMSAQAVDDDIVACNTKLEQEIGRRVLTLAYPFCLVGNSLPVVQQHYVAARICNTNMNSGNAVFTIPNRPTDMWSLGSATTDALNADSANTAVAKAITARGWLVELYHGVTQGTMQANYERHVGYLAANRDRVFVAPFGTVARYITQRRYGRIASVSQQNNTWTLRLTDTLDNAVFNVPVTLKVTLPVGWAGVAVRQGASSVWSSQTGTTLLFDAVPDGADIVITSTSSARVPKGLGAMRHRNAGGGTATYSLSGKRLTGETASRMLVRRSTTRGTGVWTVSLGREPAVR